MSDYDEDVFFDEEDEKEKIEKEINSLDCCSDNTGVSSVCKGCFAPPLAALSLTYTESSCEE